MKRLSVCFAAIVVAVSAATMAVAQPPEGRRGDGEDRPRRGPEGAPRGTGRPEFRPPSNPLVEALDANGDGEVSSDEVENAPAALAKLDKNGDGKLTIDEIRPSRDGELEIRRDGYPFTSEQFIARIMQLDKNEDGSLSVDEIPERLQRILRRADANLDGTVDKKELEQAAQRIRDDPRRGGGYRDGESRARPDRESDEASGEEETNEKE